MRSMIAVLALAGVSSALHAQSVSEERTARLDGAGLRLITIEGHAGELRVTGRVGAVAVVVRGTARASDRRYLADIRLVAERRGDVIRIEADIANDNDWRRLRNVYKSLDLIIEVPAGVAVDLEDTSGDLEITGTGALDVTDGSGGIVISDISGDVRLRDGSGEIDVHNVRGSVTVAGDGSGNIDVADVTGDVVVDSDGSGNLRAVRVAGGFRVHNKGSGSITFDDVRGAVETPSRYDRRWRSRVRVRTD